MTTDGRLLNTSRAAVLEISEIREEEREKKIKEIIAHLSAFLCPSVVEKIIKKAAEGKEITMEEAKKLAEEANEYDEELKASDAGCCPTKN